MTAALGTLALGTAALALVGCGEDPYIPPAHNREYITPSGHFVGHLKPIPFDGPPIGADGRPIEANDPVKWVVEGNKVTRPEYEIDVVSFRLDFDETQPLTEALLPFALMTENTRQIVVHRGPPPPDFKHAQINNSERCLNVFGCVNPQCPRVQQINNMGLFPVAADAAQPKCPFCGGDKVQPFVIPQHQHMRDFMKRHPQG
jgi:hypothetical protein